MVCPVADQQRHTIDGCAHPQDYPTPSGLDRTEWTKLSKRRADGRPILAVIVGRKNLYVELVPHNGIGSVMAQAN
jgi:hypothetical protein